jgi:hypothetical protein
VKVWARKSLVASAALIASSVFFGVGAVPAHAAFYQTGLQFQLEAGKSSSYSGDIPPI